MTAIQALRKRIRFLLWFFVVALILSGLTAFPLQWEVDILVQLFGRGSWMQDFWPAMADWISYVHEGISAVAQDYAFIAYGTDWLAYAHIVIGVAFIGPLRDPVKNIWVIEFGMIACVLIIPLALILGPVRGIPWFWQLFDCAFGVFGIIPLWFVRSDIRRLSALEAGL